MQGNEPALPNTRNQDLRAILNNIWLNPKMDVYFNMLITSAAIQGQKTVDPEEIIKKFRDSFEEESTLAKFTAYYSVFSDKEVHEIRQVFENPTYLKYVDHESQNMQAEMALVTDLFTGLVDKYGVINKITDVSSNSKIIEVTQENFQKEIAQSKKPVIIDVYSSACQPCHLMEPILEELSQEYGDEICFVKINCEKQSELIQKYRVTSLPTLLFIKPGQEKVFMKSSGFTSKKDFQSKIAEFLKKL